MAEQTRNPELKVRDIIHIMPEQAGWTVQSKKRIDFSAGFAIAVREYQTDAGLADYVLSINKKPVGVIEAKPGDWARKAQPSRTQSAGYAIAKLQWLADNEPDVLTQGHHREPRSRPRQHPPGTGGLGKAG